MATRPRSRQTDPAQPPVSHHQPVPKRATTRANPSPPARPQRSRADGDTHEPRSIPSSLETERRASAARSGREELLQHLRAHPESGPALTGGDIDANWELAYSSGDEAPGGDNPTPDQVLVDDIARSLGVEYKVDEELQGARKIEERDRHRWELDPASSEDYPRRTK
ncbi:MAG: hypothetical protein GEU99_02070 [Luteitalea sp.]|nr:hypothetical protein [Luteitalea sp.]